MVWFWMGPDAYMAGATPEATTKLVDELNSKAGLIWPLAARFKSLHKRM
jgi:hypothetical protein